MSVAHNHWGLELTYQKCVLSHLHWHNLFPLMTVVPSRSHVDTPEFDTKRQS